MAERPEEERLTPPIVPDADASITAHRLRHPPPPRLWPLWCLILLLGMALGGLAYLAWLERENMLGEIRRLEGQLSNVHARFDVLDDERIGGVDSLEERFDSLADDQRSLRERVEEQERLLDSVRQASIDDSELASLQQRLEALGDDLETQGAVVDAIRDSLDALERAGEDGRAVLATRLSGFEAAQRRHGERLGDMNEALSMLRETQDGLRETQGALREGQRELEEQVAALPVMDPQRLQELERDLATLAGSVETLQEQRNTDREALEAMRGRLTSNQAELTELRQNQVALSASLEALQSR
ncbi:hypothetical protein GCM10007160_03020 [Litchfieldella qijiaojingensis]|uniref:Chromosome partition protein Smc n=1 Tax=Litchfieldella qijiaojingensis TaxID=980347 RepID=A0ABQ2YBP7_9GAMM|nr:hypothetical protein [Halomonas qijiaojingensis]GGX79153.1 hypothetical protein GCM10007160_03020 [Halomonas qijiaojingensis]